MKSLLSILLVFSMSFVVNAAPVPIDVPGEQVVLTADTCPTIVADYVLTQATIDMPVFEPEPLCVYSSDAEYLGCYVLVPSVLPEYCVQNNKGSADTGEINSFHDSIKERSKPLWHSNKPCEIRKLMTATV